MIDKSKGRILYPLLFAIFSIVILYCSFQYFSPSDNYKVKTVEVSDGWGYQILRNDTVIINQPFIPVLAGKRVFPDKKSALKAGTIVKDRLNNHQLPALTKEDIEKIGLDGSGNKK